MTTTAERNAASRAEPGSECGLYLVGLAFAALSGGITGGLLVFAYMVLR